jgi:hypothetical protein
VEIEEKTNKIAADKNANINLFLLNFKYFEPHQITNKLQLPKFQTNFFVHLKLYIGIA